LFSSIVTYPLRVVHRTAIWILIDA
jgi:hypothetical protein